MASSLLTAASIEYCLISLRLGAPSSPKPSLASNRERNTIIVIKAAERKSKNSSLIETCRLILYFLEAPVEVWWHILGFLDAFAVKPSGINLWYMHLGTDMVVSLDVGNND